MKGKKVDFQTFASFLINILLMNIPLTYIDILMRQGIFRDLDIGALYR